MNPNNNPAAGEASLSDAELGGHNPLIPAFNVLRKDAERYRWLRKNLAALEFSREGNRLRIENGNASEKLDILLDELRATTEAA